MYSLNIPLILYEILENIGFNMSLRGRTIDVSQCYKRGYESNLSRINF